MHESEQSAPHYFIWTSSHMEVTEVNQKSGSLFPTLLSPTSHPTLENSHLLSSNHPICEWVIGMSAVTSGRIQRKLSNSHLDERNTACFLIYICIYINSLEKHSRELPHSPLSPAVCLLQVVTVVPLSSPRSGPLTPAFCRPFLPRVPLQVVFFGHGV